MSYLIPGHILSAMNILYENGFSPYLVGGCVRDFIMGNIPNDYDITVNASPDEIMNVFISKGFSAKLKGRQFGTVAVYAENEEMEITPNRTESNYTDSRHPDNVCFVKDLKSDLIRRDFTINALAMDKDYNIVDEFSGMADIEHKIIRCIGDAEIRFREDALRILRAIRFASRFGFRIEEKTRLAMSKNKSGLANISSERKKDELCGILKSPYSYNILCECSDIMSEIIYGFMADEFLLADKGDFSERLFACICHNNFDNICGICEALKLTNYESDKIRTMHNLYHKTLTRCGKKVLFDDNTKKALCDFNVEYVRAVFIVTDSETTELNDFIENGIYSLSKLCFSGGDIVGSGIFPKNETSKILHKVLYTVAIGEVENTRDAIEDYLLQLCKNETE